MSSESGEQGGERPEDNIGGGEIGGTFEDICKKLRYICKYRYHAIPPLILVMFCIMFVLCYMHAPAQYREIKIFQISNLGNWQEGLSFFSFCLVIIAWLMYNLTGQLLKQRIEEASDKEPNGCWFCRHPCFYKVGSIVLFLGLLFTGCFQQSYNKPWHTVGVILIGMGFFSMIVYDMGHFIYCKKKSRARISTVAQGVICFFIVVSGVGFLITNELAKRIWKGGKYEELRKINMTECPTWGVDEALSGATYPNYYPCKSKTLWLPEDPGWKNFRISSILEIIMFCFVVLYPLTYLGELKKVEDMPSWYTGNGYKRIGEQGGERTEDNIVRGGERRKLRDICKLYRFHAIPPLILVMFCTMLGLCYIHAPAQYKKIKIFQISSLGNWQEGLSFFIFCLVIIAWLMYNITRQLLKQRMSEKCDNGCWFCRHPCGYKVGSIVLFLGILFTGCFQQSYNKPFHKMGVILIALSFLLMIVYDMGHFNCKRKSLKQKDWISPVAQVVIFVFIIASGLGFVITIVLAKRIWKGDKYYEALRKINMTECPTWGVDEALFGEKYPNYYPCKSKTLWLPEDPGWNYFEISAISELIMFSFVVLYPLTYLGQLKEEKSMPCWCTGNRHQHSVEAVPEKASPNHQETCA